MQQRNKKNKQQPIKNKRMLNKMCNERLTQNPNFRNLMRNERLTQKQKITTKTPTNQKEVVCF